MPKIKSYILRQQFDPGILGIFINPFYIVRKELIKTMRKFSSKVQGRVLDVGCGHRPYEKIFSKATEYVGLEYDSPKNRARFKNIDAWYDGNKFPFASESFDSVILTQVLEHVFNPDEFLLEINRILKKNGIILISVPFAWDEHEQPHDFARYSSFGLKHLLSKSGFEVIDHVKTVTDIRMIFQLAGCYIHKKVSWIKSYKIRLCFYILFISPLTIIGTLISTILPENKDFYMDNIIIANKK